MPPTIRLGLGLGLGFQLGLELGLEVVFGLEVTLGNRNWFTGTRVLGQQERDSIIPIYGYMTI